ncbi:TVP38/TMEM64 family protein [Brachybacterium hainanense]|uniref:TVP38/TMEM64 family membrane protein n=1 Tax=Brachybacterium hainanense TaxID=1541174 RepID=A0ABV6RBN8_9MICO
MPSSSAPRPSDPAVPAGAAPRDRRLPPWGTILRNVALVAVMLGMVWLMLNVRLPPMETLRDDFEALGPWAYIGFILTYAVVAVTPIPVTVMALAGGMLFGLGIGTALSMIGVLIGCMLAYWLALAVGRETVMKLLGSHAETIEDKLAGGGFLAVCTLRLMPGIPYWPVNYGSGALGVHQREYLVATAISCLPGQLSLVAVGAYLGDPGWPTGIAVICCWALVIALTIYSLKRWRGLRRGEGGADGTQDEALAG